MTAKARKPKFSPSREHVQVFTDYLRSGISQTEALKIMGWASSSYYLKKEKDKAFSRKIDAALREYEQEIFGSNVSKFLEMLKQGADITVSIKAVGWATQTYYDRKKSDKDFERQVNAAIAEYQMKVHKSKASLLKLLNPRIVAKELDRMDAINSRYDYRNALEEAMKKEIANLNFEAAQAIAKQIEAL